MRGCLNALTVSATPVYEPPTRSRVVGWTEKPRHAPRPRPNSSAVLAGTCYSEPASIAGSQAGLREVHGAPPPRRRLRLKLVCPPAVAPGRSRSSVGGFCLLVLVLACRCGWPQSALAAGCSPRLRGRWPGASAIGCQFKAARFGGKAMEWFSRNTSIAGFQVPNWGLVLGAIIVILLIYQFMR